MNYNFLGARLRRTNTPRIYAGANTGRADHLARPALLSAFELRQLVATMVD